jgi:hypothetical protein
MKRFLSVITILLLTVPLLTVPAFAQDDFGGGFGGDSVLSASDIDALFGGRGGGNRGNQNQNNIPDPESLFLQMKDLLKNKKAPLTKDQEKTLRPFIVTEVTDMRTTLEAQFGNNRGNNNQNRGNNNQANMITEMFTIVGKNNTELLTSLKSSLTPEQVALITKAEKDKKVCTVVLDLLNPQQMQQNRGNEGNRGNRGGGNGGFNVPPGFEELIGFDGGGGGNRGNRGGNNNNNNNFLREAPDRAFCTSTASTTAERVAPISQILTKAKKPLTEDQEKSFSASIEAKYTKMQEELKAANPEMQRLLNSINDSNRNRNNNNNNTPQTVNQQTLRNNIVNTIMTNLGIQTNNNYNNNNNRGRGGNENFNPNNQNNQNNQNNPNQNAPNANANNPNANQNANNNNNNFNRGNRGNNNIQQELQRKNEELLDHIAAKLNPDQSTIIKKYKYEEIKKKGGAERYRAILEQEGTPLTAEQLNQIRNLINAQNQATRQFAEKQVTDEMAKQPTMEPPAQPNPNPNQQRNPNNVNQNPIAQQIVSTLMPLVSRQHALLERTTADTILKLLTPPQVASYKINSL